MQSKPLLILLLAFMCWHIHAQDTVTVIPATHYQTIAGWGHGGGILGGANYAYSMLPPSIADPVNYQMLDYLADDLGLTGSRTWDVGPRTDGTGMDNGDCDSIDWSKFQSNTLPVPLANYLVYFRDKVLAQGIQPSFYSSPGYPTHATDQKPWVLYHPGERAQQIWANALYMQNTYGIHINYDVIYNEPSGPITAGILADDIKALGPRLISHGLTTQSQYAEAVAPQTDWDFITPVQDDSVMWSYVGRISYHNYGTADPYRSYLNEFGITKGLTTAQTETANPTFDDLYSDLTLANASYWEVAYSSSNTLVPSAGLTSFTPSSTYFRMRQVMHYVRPGAMRIETTSTNPLVHVLAFSKTGEVTTIIENTSSSSRTVYLSGLPPGSYGLSQSPSGGTSFQEQGVLTVGSGGSLAITVNGGSSVATLYPYSGPNRPPTIMTWGTNPGYLLAPASTDILSVTANDPELDPIAYHWTVTSQPAGANVSITSPNAASTGVTRLTVAGTYIFNVDVQDGVNTSSKKVYLVAYSSNPQPVLGQTGFRIATPYGLVFGAQGDTTHANIELPVSSVILQAGIADLANDDFTGRGQWSLVSQPAGANVIIGSTIYIYVSIRAQVTGMTAPGDYVFQVNITNPGYPDLTARIICTVHPASSAPVITSISPSPAIMTLPVNTTLLTAVTSDPEGDLLRHWWAVKSVPNGAWPVFDHQGLPVSNVTGLTVPGTYTFTLRSFDDIHMTAKDVSVIVNKDTLGIENHSADYGDVVIYPNPVSEDLNVLLPGNHDKISRLILLNCLGQEVMEQLVTQDPAGKIALPLKSIPAGIYFLTVQTKDKIISRKIIKQ